MTYDPWFPSGSGLCSPPVDDVAAPLRPLDRPAGRRRRRTRHPERLIAYSFAAVVLIGTALLMLPVAVDARDGAPFVTALFTSTSAVCVTGLAVVDTGTYWSPFGQVVIMLLIQVGGLGIMTLASVGLLLLGRRLGLRRRVLSHADKGAVGVAVVKRLVVLVATLTLMFELFGAAILALRFATGYGYAPWRAIWHGAFHSVSAFNNAGFGLLPTNLSPFVQDWPVNLAVMTMIIAGGLGFPVWLELREHGVRDLHHLTLHTKLMLVGTFGLLVFGALVTLALEWSNPATLGQYGALDKVLPSMFQSVTPRTAGFNTLDFSQMREESWLTQMMLMFVGAGPASTGGGIKVTTFLVLFLFIASEARGVPDTVAFGRRIPVEAIRQSFSIAFIAMNAVVIGTLVMLTDSHFAFVRVLFEAVSAFGTVGLSTGITPHLPDLSQYVLIALMYLGRVGPYTLALAFALRQRPIKIRYATEAPIIG
jgi:trk system potassium uptake protein